MKFKKLIESYLVGLREDEEPVESKPSEEETKKDETSSDMFYEDTWVEVVKDYNLKWSKKGDVFGLPRGTRGKIISVDSADKSVTLEAESLKIPNVNKVGIGSKEFDNMIKSKHDQIVKMKYIKNV